MTHSRLPSVQRVAFSRDLAENDVLNRDDSKHTTDSHHRRGKAVELERGVGSLSRIQLCREELQHSIQIDFMVLAFAHQEVYMLPRISCLIDRSHLSHRTGDRLIIGGGKNCRNSEHRVRRNGSRSELETLCRRHAPVDRGDTKLIGALFANRNYLGLNINCHHAPEVRRHGNGDASRSTRKIEKEAMSGDSCGVAQMR